MTVPTLDKTWLFNVNQSVGGTGAVLGDNQDCIFKIKNALKVLGSNPWVVWGSCDGQGGSTFGNGDMVDRWHSADSSHVVWAASGNHSWIVLLQSAGMGGAQVCIDLFNANSNNLTLVFSPGGLFAAGTATARPTASDELVLISNTYWGGSSGAYYTKGLHVMVSNDGQCTRVILCRANICNGMWIFEKAKNPVAAWTAPYFAGAVGNDTSTEVATYGNWNDGARCVGRYGSASVSHYMTSAFYGSATVGENQAYPDDNTIEWPINTIGLASGTSGHRGGRKGEVFDLYWGATAPQIGATYPEDASKQFAQFGHLIFPWNGTTPKTA